MRQLRLSKALDSWQTDSLLRCMDSRALVEPVNCGRQRRGKRWSRSRARVLCVSDSMHPPGACGESGMCLTRWWGYSSSKSPSRAFTTCEMYRSILEDCKSGELFWFGVVMKASCTNFTRFGHVLHLAVSAFLAPTCDQRVYRSTQSVLKIDLATTHFSRKPQPVLELR